MTELATLPPPRSPEAGSRAAGLDAPAPPAHDPATCAHCGLPIPLERRPEPGQPGYCCSGCETVAATLARMGLTDYYRLADAGRPAQTTKRSYAEFDDPAFAERYVSTSEDGSEASLTLYLEGVHCGACVWLIETLPRSLPGVVSTRVELARSVAELRYRPGSVPLSRIVRALDDLGYPAHPYRGAERAERRRQEDRRAWRQLAIAGALAGNVMLVSFATYGGLLHGIEAAHALLFRWVAFALCLPAVFGPGRVFLRGALSALRTRTPHVDLPVALALLAGLAGGAFNTLRGAGEVYFDTVSVLVFLLLVGRWLQGKQRRRAADAAELLTSLTPSSARVIEEEGAREVAVESLALGDLVEVRAGERVPVDGEAAGAGWLDASLLTGESRPREVQAGDAVHAGTINRGGALRVRATACGEATRVAQLAQEVEAQSRRHAPVVAWADRIAGRFVLVVLALALTTFGLWSLLDPAHALDHSVALLIVTCPCALGLATPLALHAALGRAARRGALVKGGDALQRLGSREGARHVFLDKTGTLTEGRHRLLTWEVAPQEDPQRVQALVLGLEAASAHAIAEGFRAAWSAAAEPAEETRALPGGGLAGRVAGRALRLGSPLAVGLEPASAQANALRLSPEQGATLERLLAAGQTPVVLAEADRCLAIAGFGDPLRADAAEALRCLESLGWTVSIASGDHPRVVAAAARALGVPPERAEGGLTPEDKLARVYAAREAGAQTLMVGDGANDAAALAAADVGIGVRGSTEATLSAADVYLSRGGLRGLVELIALARATLTRVHLNLALSLLYNVVAAGLAVGGLVDPIVAALLMPLSSASVVANSYRGLDARPAPGPKESPCP